MVSHVPAPPNAKKISRDAQCTIGDALACLVSELLPGQSPSHVKAVQPAAQRAMHHRAVMANYGIADKPVPIPKSDPSPNDLQKRALENYVAPAGTQINPQSNAGNHAAKVHNVGMRH